jgi:cell shape-determining protein MreD
MEGLLVVGLVALHFTFHRFFAHWSVAPNLLVGALLLAALWLRAGYAAFLGFSLGVLESAMGLEGMGTIALVLTLLGYAAARSRDLLFADARYYTVIYLFFGTWLGEIGLMAATPGGMNVLGALVLAPLSAFATAVVCGSAETLVSAARRY